MYRLVNSLLSGAVPRFIGTHGKQRLSIMIYHRVLPDFDYMLSGVPTINEFTHQMELIARHFHPLSLSSALELMDQGKLPERAICVTFDDGYADNAEVALPVLNRLAIPVTIFVSTGFLDGGRMWNDTVIESVRHSRSSVIDLSSFQLGVFTLDTLESRRKCAYSILQDIKYRPHSEREAVAEFLAERSADLPDNLMLSTVQLRKVHADGVEIGAHTHTHPILSSLRLNDVHDEVLQSKVVLEKILGKSVRFFAYPNGIPGRDYVEPHRDLVQEMGFEAALSTRWGVSGRETDRWQLPRFTPWDKAPPRFMLRLLLNERNLV